MHEKIPQLGQRAVTVITDCETGKINTFKQQIENCNILICWNHILNDITFWVNKHDGKTDDKRVNDMQIHELLHSESVKTFEQKYFSIKQQWS